MSDTLTPEEEGLLARMVQGYNDGAREAGHPERVLDLPTLPFAVRWFLFNYLLSRLAQSPVLLDPRAPRGTLQ